LSYLNPILKDANGASQSTSSTPEPAVLPFAPTQKGVFGCREAIVPAGVSFQFSFSFTLPELHL